MQLLHLYLPEFQTLASHLILTSNPTLPGLPSYVHKNPYVCIVSTPCLRSFFLSHYYNCQLYHSLVNFDLYNVFNMAIIMWSPPLVYSYMNTCMLYTYSMYGEKLLLQETKASWVGPHVLYRYSNVFGNFPCRQQREIVLLEGKTFANAMAGICVSACVVGCLHF